MIRRIISYMARFRDICRIVEVVDRANTKQVKDDHKIGLDEGDDFYGDFVERDEVMKTYMMEYGSSKPETISTCNLAVENDYLEIPNRKYDQQNLRLKVTPNKGVNIIQRRFGVRTGLIRAVLEENKTLIETVFTIVLILATIINIYIGVKYR